MAGKWRRLRTRASLCSTLSGLTFAVLLALVGTPRAGLAQIRIACIGDSITVGARLKDRAHANYPWLLGQRLGPDYAVRNFGVGGRTLLAKGDTPYVDSKAWKAVLDDRAQIAILMLGTNDTVENARRENWRHNAGLEQDVRAMVTALRADNEAVRIILVPPPPIFPERPGLSDERRQDLAARAPRIRALADRLSQLALDENIECARLDRQLQAERTVDGVHPNAFGSERLARFLAEWIESAFEPDFDTRAALTHAKVDVRTSGFHGFEALDFDLAIPNPVGCKLVRPHTVAKGRPWLWRARFFGHQPALDCALLDRGWHLAYVDVANLYGNTIALDRYDAAYRFFAELGLAPRVLLEAMSRGGLVSIRWAARHPDRVLAVYGDNPVCDLRSWPGGKSGKRSDADWARCLRAYGLDDGEMADFDSMPLDVVDSLSHARVPLLLRVGGRDEVVPPRENALALFDRHRRLGGPARVWIDPEGKHHPHGLHPVGALVREVLRVHGRDTNPSVRAMPSVEHRGRAAGWGGLTWHAAWQHLRGIVRDHADAQVVFLGDSITQGLTGHVDRVSRVDGSRLFDKLYGNTKAISLGLSGDRCEHILWRLENGQLDGLAPRAIVVMIGINDIHTGHRDGHEVAAGAIRIVSRLESMHERAEILLLGCFPTGAAEDHRERRAVREYHEVLAKHEFGPRVHYRNLCELFVRKDGTLNDRMARDGVHLTPKGVESWLRAIDDWVRSAVAGQPVRR